MKNVISDLSTLTLIPESVLKELVRKGELCIAHNVIENFKEQEVLTQINIGIGILSIMIEEDTLKYKFLPADHLNEVLLNAIDTNTSPLINAVENKLADKIMDTYKTLF